MQHDIKEFVYKFLGHCIPPPPRTKSRSNVRVNVLARSNVLAQTNKNEIVLLRKLI